MNKEQISLAGVIASGVLVLATANPVWFVVMVAFGIYFGWNLGKRLIPSESGS